uniref:Uncharacterized protein n=1 Tax=Peromyscus maniculatus bairdii TaxID=230844 RepID=A0A8C8UD25_PERMB
MTQASKGCGEEDQHCHHGHVLCPLLGHCIYFYHKRLSDPQLQEMEKGVKHLTKAIAVGGQPQQMLQLLQQMLPQPVFQMIVNVQSLAGVDVSEPVINTMRSVKNDFTISLEADQL